MIPDEIGQRIGVLFSGHVKSIQDVMVVGGGSINHAVQFSMHQRKYFLKWNDATRYPGMFEAEAKGLQLLSSTKTFHIPEVLHTGLAVQYSFLLMEFVTGGRSSATFWSNFGIALARLHRYTAPLFGLDHHNYIGSLQQSNRQHSTWNEFFIVERIEPQLKRAIDSQKISSSAIINLQKLTSVINEIIPLEKPALLHGDLWNGNFLVTFDGKACLVDPAVYYGHREMDLAMTRLFGGFDDDFYRAYHSELPLEPGFENRLEIHNLYPLLVHVNLFGGGYINQVKNILSRF